MEGTLAPRSTFVDSAVGFHETGDGATLVLGRPKYLARVAAVAAAFVFIAVLSFVMSTLAAAQGDPSFASRIIYMVYGFAALDAVIILALVLQGGRWVLLADGTGVHLVRSRRGPKDLGWPEVRRIQYGPTSIRTGRYGASLGDALRIDSAHSLSPILLDTVRFRVRADDMDRMAAVLKDLGGRHGVPVEPFPMAGRELR